MNRHLRRVFSVFVILAVVGSSSALVKQKGTWTNPDDPTMPAVFRAQGEYSGTIAGKTKVGAQVIALDEDGAVQAVVYPGGLPGDGWDGTNKILLDGKLTEGKVELRPVEGKRKYIDRTPANFSATKEFPPKGHQPWTGVLAEDVFSGKTHEGQPFVMKKIRRESPTLGAKPPEGLRREGF